MHEMFLKTSAKCLYPHYPLEGTYVCFQVQFMHKANFLIKKGLIQLTLHIKYDVNVS